MASTKDHKDLAPRPGGPLAVADLPEPMQDRIRRKQAAAQARNTSAAYGAQLRLFKAWCQLHAFSDAPPVAPAIVAAWLTERAEAGASRSTLTVALAAIKFGHRIAGQRFDGADPELQRALAGARREAVAEQRQAAPLRPAVLREVLASMGDSDLDRRDAAMLATLYMLALRRSELVDIDYQTRGDGDDGGLAVLRMTDCGLELELLRSKTSQEKPVRVAVDRHHNPRAFAALEKWIAHARIASGAPLFRRINPRGVSVAS
jgi:site-specific recombinase XerC